ncbi:MAG: MAPEG family protein [Colwellia sp.]|nr:MAPEG family protein [Colwellia sp.]
MEFSSLLTITPTYIAMLGLIFIPLTARVALYRIKSKISIGIGGDSEMELRMRGQANFIETVPITLFLLISMELLGASDTWLHTLGLTLVLARISHYIGLTKLGPLFFRIIGIAATLGTILVASIWILTI